jgi:hypothetical protein
MPEIGTENISFELAETQAVGLKMAEWENFLLGSKTRVLNFFQQNHHTGSSRGIKTY